MATTKEYRDYIEENLQRAGEVILRPMMGEYCVYVRDKVAGLICDNTLMLKNTPTVAELLPDAEVGYPYEGSRTLMRFVSDVENVPLMEEVLAALYAEVPEKKKAETRRGVRFRESVYDAVRRIPEGRVATYGTVAELAGYPGAARAVGNALHSNPYPGVVPCHRVVRATGELCDAFAFGGAERQEELLTAEGVEVRDLRVDIRRFGWKGQKSGHGK